MNSPFSSLLAETRLINEACTKRQHSKAINEPSKAFQLTTLSSSTQHHDPNVAPLRVLFALLNPINNDVTDGPNKEQTVVCIYSGHDQTTATVNGKFINVRTMRQRRNGLVEWRQMANAQYCTIDSTTKDKSPFLCYVTLLLIAKSLSNFVACKM